MNAIASTAVVALALLIVTGAAATPASQGRKIQLVVVGVPEFATDKYNVTGLKSAIEERCGDLKDFFEKYVGKEKLDEHIFCTKQDTTAIKVKRLFQTDFKDIAANTLTFVFIVSHGEPANYDNKGLPRDLKIVTSTSTPNEPDASYLAFTTELLSWFQTIPTGSTVLTFIDTCYAGNALSPAAAMSASVQQIFGGTRLFVMGSSLRLEESYGAAFTKALLSLWNKQDGCVDPQTMGADIRDEIDRTIETPLSDFEGIAKVIVGYAGPLCFTNFGTNGRLLFLYGGTGPEDMVWKVFGNVNNKEKQLKHGAFTERFFDMVRLNAGTYKVQFLTKDQAAASPTAVDLKSHSFEAVFAAPPRSVRGLQGFVGAMHDAVVANGSSSSDAELLKQVSSSLQARSNDINADALLRSVNVSGAVFQNLGALREAAFKYKRDAQSIWQAKQIAPENAAAGLFLLGDIANSAEAFKLEASLAADEKSRHKFAQDAFVAFKIAGMRDDAALVDLQYDVRSQSHVSPANTQHTVGVGPSGSFDTIIRHIQGSGSTSATPLYSKLLDDLDKKDSIFQFDYEPVASENPIKDVSEHEVDFITTGSPLTDEQMKAYQDKHGFSVLHFPSAMSAVVPVYNVPGVDKTLNFSPNALAGIFLGKIKKWNDPAIAKDNKEVALPEANIVVVHRSDSSVETYTWTDYLAKASDKWERGIGQGASVKWPVGLAGKGNEGVAGLVAQNSNSIGYIDFTYAVANNVRYGAVLNSAGAFVRATQSNITAAAASFGEDIPDDFRISVTNAPGKDAYPIAAFTWLLVPQKLTDSAKRNGVETLLNFVLLDGQSDAEALGYARLPKEMVAREEKAISRIENQP